MTGEMAKIDSKGRDSNSDEWPVHAYVARALRRPLRPFDVYIGPYIACKEGRLWLGSDDGAWGYACLWPGGVAPAYRDPIVVDAGPCDDQELALAAARECLKQYRRSRKAA